jgi:hypothetical protein
MAMRESDSEAYYRARAERERRLAAATRDERAAAAHLDLARRYERRAIGDLIFPDFIAE